MNRPIVSVLMPVYNGEAYLQEAIESILEQQFSDFEFLIIDDASTDKSNQIIKAYSDPRIKLFRNNNNLGIAKTLNKGLALAQGRYIARMDSDDISLPSRLKEQVGFMNSNPSIGISGTWIRYHNSSKNNVWQPPTTNEEIMCSLLYASALAHPSVIMRASILKQYNLTYDDTKTYAQDYDLWVRAMHFTHLANISEIHLLYRIHPKQIGQFYSTEQLAAANSVRESLLKSIGIHATTEELGIHQNFILKTARVDKLFVERTEAWLCKLRVANSQKHFFPEPHFTKTLANHWFSVCYSASDYGLWILIKFILSSLNKPTITTLKRAIVLTIKCCKKEAI